MDFKVRRLYKLIVYCWSGYFETNFSHCCKMPNWWQVNVKVLTCWNICRTLGLTLFNSLTSQIFCWKFLCKEERKFNTILTYKKVGSETQIITGSSPHCFPLTDAVTSPAWSTTPSSIGSCPGRSKPYTPWPRRSWARTKWSPNSTLMRWDA